MIDLGSCEKDRECRGDCVNRSNVYQLYRDELGVELNDAGGLYAGLVDRGLLLERYTRDRFRKNQVSEYCCTTFTVWSSHRAPDSRS